LLSSVEQFAPGTTSKVNLIADCVVVACATLLSTLGTTHAWSHLALAMTGAVTVWLFGARIARQYDEQCEGILAELALTLVLVSGVALTLLIIEWVLPAGRPTNLGVFLVWSWPGVWFARSLVVVYRSWLAAPPEQVLVVGTEISGRSIAAMIEGLDRRRFIVGFLTWREGGTDGSLPAPVLGSWGRLEAALRQYPIAEVYLAGNPIEDGDAMQACIETCEIFGVPFALPAIGFRLTRGRPTSKGARPRDGYVHFLNVEYKPVQMALKRLFDIVVSAFALWALSPLFLLNAMVIKLTSAGPVFFKQERMGHHARTFSMLKFRSMVLNAEERKQDFLGANEQAGPVFKMTRDPRVTPVGRFMRKYSIDELPQLVNVLRGDMSIVGPRPPLPSEVAQYESWQCRRLSVRPGLTCLWQVSGRNRVGFIDWMRLDMYYIDHWSLRQDLNLIVKTVPVVLTGRGAS
jgi:exopolysaccharide biosynthesis polyprenyl glycosylphosphotransferase